MIRHYADPALYLEPGNATFPFGYNALPVYCPKCEQTKMACEFTSKGKAPRRKVDAYCKICRAELSTSWAKAHPEEQRARVRISKLRWYGVTAEQIEQRFEEQGRCCAICKSPTPGKNDWCKDHNHITHVFRGILCHACNLTLGNAKEDVSRLLACVAYLENQSVQ